MIADRATRNILRHGSAADAPEIIPLTAGPLTCDYVNGDLRNIRLGDREIVRRIYVAVRDRYWNTIPATLEDVRITSGASAFTIRYRATHRAAEICFRWHAMITGDASGEIVFAMDGEACSTFLRNRIGICVLHPNTCAGAPCRVTHTDGTVTTGAFPRDISPHQPYKDVCEIAHRFSRNIWARVAFSGEVFEMEDQRNWTDASFKTYSTPLEWPAPVLIEHGTPVRQTVRLNLEGDAPARAVRVAEGDVRLTLAAPLCRALPPVGLGADTLKGPLDDVSVAALRRLHLSHLRVSAGADGDRPQTFALLAREATALDCPLEIALPLASITDAWVAELAQSVTAAGCGIARWLLLCDDLTREEAAQRLARLRPRLEEISPDGLVGSGTHHYFTEFNRHPPPVQGADFVCYTLNPQVHASDDLSLMETLPIQAETVSNASRIAGGRPVAISPITLRPRYNLHLAAEGTVADLQADARQSALFGAAWTLGSMATLAGHPALASLTYYELAGPAGVLQPAVPNTSTGLALYPVYHLLRWLGSLRGAALRQVNNTAPERVAALACDTPAGPHLALANLTPRAQRVLLAVGDLALSVLRLDEETAIGMAAVDNALENQIWKPASVREGEVSLELLPYGLVFLRP